MSPEHTLTRRSALAGTAALFAGSLLAPGESAAGAAAGGRRAAGAAAAGTITLGNALVVNRLGYGAMRITGEGIWGEPKDAREARAVLRRAVDLGVNFIDTADSYGPEVSERLIAEALHPYPRGLIVATKGGIVRPGPSQWVPDGRPAHLRAACEASLRRLKMEKFDLYQFHRIDPQVPVEESLGELAKLRDEGKIVHLGISNFKLDELEKARSIVPVVSVQNRYNVVDRSSQAVLDYCEAQGMAFIPWSPLSRNPRDAQDDKMLRLATLAQTRGVSVPQIAIAWLLAKSPAMLPIPGTSSRRHLEENVAAAAVELSREELAAVG